MAKRLREQLALAMANALRNSLEPFHGPTESRSSGLTDEVMRFLNRRAARRCYEMLDRMSVEDVLAVTDWARWASAMWDAAVKTTKLESIVNIPVGRLKVSQAETRRNLHIVRSVLCVSVAKKLEFIDAAAAQPLPLMPVGWDSPSAAVPAVYKPNAPTIVTKRQTGQTIK